jgi:hypothetical protein
MISSRSRTFFGRGGLLEGVEKRQSGFCEGPVLLGETEIGLNGDGKAASNGYVCCCRLRLTKAFWKKLSI